MRRSTPVAAQWESLRDTVVLRSTRLARLLTTPLGLGDYLGLVDPLLNGRELRGRVIEVRAETDEASTLVIRPGVGWRFRHRPGQFISVGVQMQGRFHWRSYSLTSSPEWSRRRLTITVKAMPEGVLSGHLAHGVRPGTVIRLAAPAGEFVLPEPPPPRMLLLGAGSGLTPLVAMLRTLRHRGSLPDVVMVTSFPGPDDALFRAELAELASTTDSFRLVEHWSGTSGRLRMRDLGSLVPDWQERETWACGPEALLDACEELWESRRRRDALHVERYTPGTGKAEGAGGTIRFVRSDRSVDVDGATTLLEAGEQAGVAMPYGCRMGICHTCVVPLKTGTVIDIRTGDTADEANRYVQTCVSVAATDCELQI